MEQFIESLNGKLDIVFMSVPYGICLLVCILWGIISVSFCPCHMASISLIINYIKDQKNMTLNYAFRLTLIFSFAILLVVCSIGLITLGLGRVLEETGKALDYVIGIVFVLVGLHIIGLIKYHHHDRCDEEEHDEHCGAINVEYKKKGYIGAFVYGLIFGVLLSPCTFAYMAPIMGIALKRSIDNQIQAFLMFFCYGIGEIIIITTIGTFTEFLSKYNHWSHDSKASKIIKIICGIIIILAGIHMFFE